MSDENQTNPEENKAGADLSGITQSPDPEGENTPDELTLLKQRADLLGIKYKANIGADKLKERIEVTMSGNLSAGTSDESSEDDTGDDGDEALTPAQIRIEKRREMLKSEMRMVRVRITNLNPTKADLPGEIFTVANKFIGIVKKYVPYGEVTENGYHLPWIIFKQLKARKFQSIKTKPNRKTGQIDVSTQWVPEFALEILPDLTKEELKDLAATQAASHAID